MSAEPTELVVADAAAWRGWLEEHHDTPEGVWLVLAKKGTTTPTSLSHDEALDEALCHGWIDGQTGRRDDGTFWQRFTPRRARSTWSLRNVDHVERLAAQGRMQPAGIAEVDRARGTAGGRRPTPVPPRSRCRPTSPTHSPRHPTRRRCSTR